SNFAQIRLRKDRTTTTVVVVRSFRKRICAKFDRLPITQDCQCISTARESSMRQSRRSAMYVSLLTALTPYSFAYQKDCRLRLVHWSVVAKISSPERDVYGRWLAAVCVRLESLPPQALSHSPRWLIA